MKLSVKGLAFAGALVWGIGGLFCVGLCNLIWPGYGGAFLDVMASVYPGYHHTMSFGSVIVGTLYGIVDGGVGGAVIAWLHNRCAS